ncbi:MAG: SDR family NAD(P)-dependent oxidoreductase [Spirochaetia bacterium]|nr:SDR family NAD(P)-dependent oxidoreductase [Spirochaetia bacterium]
MKPVTIVTGATGAIGKAIARQMAENGYEVIMICRNAQKAEAARKEIIQTTKNQNVFVEIADLSRLSGIKSLAARMQAPVFSLINNAAATPMSREETADGI